MSKRFILSAMLATLLLLSIGCGMPGDPMPDDAYTRNIYPGNNNAFSIGDYELVYSEGHFETLYVSGESLYIDGVKNPWENGGNGGNGGMEVHGNEYHTPDFTTLVDLATDANLSSAAQDAIAKKHGHGNKSILDAIEEAFTATLKTLYDNAVALLNAHIDNISNPHEVTKAQVGLSNVTDDAQIAKSIGTAKGDIIVFTASGTPVRLTVGSNGQILVADSAQPSGINWSTPTGGGESEATVVLQSDVANSTTTLANANGLSFAADANSTYIIEGFIVWNSSGTAVGIKVSATGPASPAIMSGHFITDAANGTPDSSSFNADNVTVTTSASAFTAGNLGMLHAVLKTNANSGTFQVRFAAETTGTITIKAGSCLRYRKVA